MQRDDLAYVGHMPDTARWIVGKVAGKSRSEFDADENLRLALVHLIPTLGESARRVSREFQGTHPGVPWKEMTGMRRKVVHDSLHVDYDIVWNVGAVRMPVLVS